MTAGVRRIIINTAAGTGARVAALCIVFVTTPVLIDHLGAEAFGLFAIVAALPAYAGLLDFGIGPGLVRHLTEYSQRDGAEGVRQVMTFALCFYLVLGLVLTPLVYLLTPHIVRWFGMPEHLRGTVDIAVVVMFSYFIVSGIVGVFSARLVSLHRMDITATTGLFGQMLYGALVLVVIPVSPTVLTAVWLNVAQLLTTGALMCAVVLRMDRRIVCNPLRIRGALARKVFAFGGWMQLNSLTALVNLEADKLIIAGFLNMAVVTPYQIGNRLASLNRIIPFQLLSAIMPAATLTQIGGSRGEAAGFYREMSRYLMLLTLSITGFTAIAADRLIVTWIGRPYPQATLILLALSFSFAVNNLTGGGTTMVQAAGQPRYETYYAVLSMALNLGLTVALAPAFGLAGILGGTIIANVIGSVFFIVLFHRRFRIPWFQTMGDWLWRLLGATALACLAVYLMRLWLVRSWQPGGLPGDRLTGLVLLTIYGIAYVGVFAAGLTALGFWSDRDLDAFRRVMLKVRPFGRRG